MRAVPACVLIALTAGAAGCVHEMSSGRVAPGISPSPEVPWTPPPSLAAQPSPAARPAEIPADLLESSGGWRLVHLLDLALRNSPTTRAAWASARSAAASLGSDKGAWYPTIGLQADRSTIQGSAAGGLINFQQGSYGATLNLTYLILDSGGRSASIEMARQALIAADWAHNAAIQDVALTVEQAYYQYLFTKALLEAERATVTEREASLDAANARRQAGVATIADVLQAKTVLSQARLALETTEGQIQTIKGVLATAMGLPANTAFEVEIPADDLPLKEFSDEVDRLIEEAQAKRPDLAAARSRVLEAQAKIRNVRSQGLPSLVTNWSSGIITYTGSGSTQETYNGALLLRVPIFNGLTLQYDLLRARADEDLARANLDRLEQDVISQVWIGYYNVKTAARRIETSRDLLDSATQSYDVALGRYKAGVGSILDLLTAQSMLDNARAQTAQAKADWHLSLAQLAHDTGTLTASSGGGAGGTP